jgi:predicted flap endonuclease-1-like 5' DNA nuclease
MSVLALIILGILIGWLIEWIIDWLFWRRRNRAALAANSNCQNQVAKLEGEIESLKAGKQEALVASSRSRTVKLGDDDSEAKMAELEKENADLKARLANMVERPADDLTQIKGVGPKIAGLMRDAGIMSFAQLGAMTADKLRDLVGDVIERLADEDEIIEQARELAKSPGPSRSRTVKISGDDNQAKVSELEAEIVSLKSRMANMIERPADDLTKIKGIGPKIAGLMQDAGIKSFAQLGDMTADNLRDLVGDVIERLADEDEIIEQARELAKKSDQGK